MQLKVDVDEADIGRVREGQAATFTVDAYPHRRFDAHVASVRFAPKTVEGVVTYEAVLAFDNSALLLRPGMTATADIVTNKLTNVLRVPNAALRVKPPNAIDSAPPSEDPSTRTLWVLPAGTDTPKAVRAHIGESDGHYTELADGTVDVGTARDHRRCERRIRSGKHRHVPARPAWHSLNRPRPRRGAHALVELRAATKVYGHGPSEVRALDGIDLQIMQPANSLP